jgi:hypothetical protein
MSPEGREVGSKTFCAPLIVTFLISFGTCTATPMLGFAAQPIGFAAQPIPSTDTTGTAAEAATSPNQADAKIQSLLGQIETAITQGRMVSPPNDNATAMLSIALAMLPLASPQGESLMTAFPLLLRQQASQHPQNSADFLAFSNLVSSVLPSTDHVNGTDVHPEAATNGGQGIAEPQPLSGAASAGMPGTTATTDAGAGKSLPPQAPPAKATSVPRVAGGPQDTALVEHTPAQGMAAAGNLPGTATAAERTKAPVSTPPDASVNNSDHSPNAGPVNAAHTPTFPALETTAGKAETTTPPPIREKAQAAQPAPANTVAIPPVTGDQPSARLATADAPNPGLERKSDSGSKHGSASGIPSPSVSVAAAPPTASSSLAEVPATAKAAEQTKVVAPTPPHAWANDGDRLPNAVAVNSKQMPISAIPRRPEVQQQPLGPAQHSSTALLPATGKADASTPGPIHETPQVAQPAPAKVVTMSPVGANQPDTRLAEQAPVKGLVSSDSPDSGTEQGSGAGSIAPSPSVSVSAAPPTASSTPGDFRATAKAAERTKSAPTPPHTSVSDSNHSPNPVPINTAETPTSSPSWTPEVQQQTQTAAKLSSTAIAATPDEANTTTPGPILGNLAKLRDAQASAMGLPGQQRAAAAVQSNPADQGKKPPARQVADEASRAAPSGTSRELKLALARPLAELPQTAASAPQPPAKHPNAVLPEFVRALVRRGDDLILLGDISGARRLYALAAEDGDGQAAKRLGDTYNPEFLSEHHVQGLQPDINTAEEWYRKAAALGDPDASETLRYLSSSRR